MSDDVSDRWKHDEYIPVGFWDDVAALPGLRPVLDFADEGGAKNDLIDRLHRRALRHGLGALDVDRFATAVDFGCGIGRLTPGLLDVAGRAIGIDPSLPMVERARRECADPRVEFVQPGAVTSVEGPALAVSVYVLYSLPRPVVVEALAGLRAMAEAGAARFVGVERMIGPSPQGPQGIEPRDVGWYADALREAGWTLLGSRSARRSDSLPLRIHRKASPLLRGPLTAAAARAVTAAEFATAARPFRGNYVDVVFWAA